MDDPLETLLISKAQEITRQEIEELKLDSLSRRRRILAALIPERSPTIRERLVAFFNEWRFMSGSAIGAAAMGILAVTIYPGFDPNTRSLTTNELGYAEALGEAMGASPLKKSPVSAMQQSTSAYETLTSTRQQIDPQAQAYITETSGSVPLVVTIAARDPIEAISSDLEALKNLEQSILSVDYSSNTRRGLIVAILSEELKRHLQGRYGVDLKHRTRQQTDDIRVSLQYAPK